MIELLIGVILALLAIFGVSKLSLSNHSYSLMLFSLPLIYAGFGVYAGDAAAVMKEMLWGVPFFIAAALCIYSRKKAFIVLLASFWFLHGAYDVFHDVLLINPGVPSWYPVFCLGFDAVVGSYLLLYINRVTLSE